MITCLEEEASDHSLLLCLPARRERMDADGVPGAMFATGLSTLWPLGLTIGAYSNYLLAPRLRAYTEAADDAITIPDFFDKRFQHSSSLLKIVSALIIMIFSHCIPLPVWYLADGCLNLLLVRITN